MGLIVGLDVIGLLVGTGVTGCGVITGGGVVAMGNGVGGSVSYKNAEKGIHNRILDEQITTIPCQAK